MKVWIFQTGEPLHSDNGFPRPMRAMNLANKLVEQGHQVTIWSSAFYHQKKIHRYRTFKSISINDQLTIRLVPSLGYKKNIGLGRLFDHLQLAFNLRFILYSKKWDKPDVAFVGYPPIEAAWVMLSWLRQNNVPVLVDVKDQWPHIFLEPFPMWLRPIARLAFLPFFLLARKTLSKATAICSMSNSYLQWALKVSGRSRNDFDMIAPLTASIVRFSPQQLEEAESWWLERGVDLSTKRRFSFVGSFMSVFDFTMVREAALRFKNEGIDCQFVIAGHGAYFEKIRGEMSGLNNVVFPGWIDLPQFTVLAAHSMGALVPYKNIDNYKINIPNKVVDSLAYGLPIVTTLGGEAQNLIVTEELGFSCNADTQLSFYLALKALLDDENLRSKIAANARRYYEKNFDADNVYSDLVWSLERVATNGR